MSGSSQAFEEQIGSLLYKRTNGGETTTDISRKQVEDIGQELGMTPGDACTQFFTIRGSVWEVNSNGLHDSTIHSEESSSLPPPRNWLGINDIYLIQ